MKAFLVAETAEVQEGQEHSELAEELGVITDMVLVLRAWKRRWSPTPQPQRAGDRRQYLTRYLKEESQLS